MAKQKSAKDIFREQNNTVSFHKFAQHLEDFIKDSSDEQAQIIWQNMTHDAPKICNKTIMLERKIK